MDQTILFDLETTAIGPFGETPDRIHVAVLHEFETGKRVQFLQDEMEEAATILTNAEYVVAHNALGFDINVMKAHTSYVETKGMVLDTLVLCNMFEGDIKEKVDYERFDRDKADKKPTDPHYFSGQLIGSQALEAWGMRLGKPKDNYKNIMKKQGLDPWAVVNDHMISYCHTDVDILVLLWERLLPFIQNPNIHDAIECEHVIQTYMTKLEHEGTFFDVGAAQKLVGELQAHLPKVTQKIQDAFPPKIEPLKWVSSEYIGNQKEGEKGYDAWERSYINSCRPYERYYPGGDINVSEMGEVFTPKRTMYSPQFQCDRIKHASYCKIGTKIVNPGSRIQLTRRLKAQGWVPTKFTDAGNPQLDEDVLTDVGRTIPAANTVARLYLLNKRLSQIANGTEAWLKKVAPDGRIHPRISPCATITHRPTHSKPNMSQVPSVQFKKNQQGESVIAFGEDGGWGYECRALFVPPRPDQIRGEKWVQVGSDLAGLELRCLAHYLWEFDNGEFANVLLNEDVHANNQQIMGLANRTDAKSVIFACVTMDTEALTKTGWKKYEELKVGDVILTYNADKKVQEWKPVLEKVFYEQAPIIETSIGKHWKIKSTPNHRWFVSRRTGHRAPRYYVDDVRTTETLSTECSIITNAPLEEEYNGDKPFDSPWLSTGKYETDWVDYILRCNPQQREAFLAGFAVADGWSKTFKNTIWKISQNEGNFFDAVQLAAYLATDRNLITADRDNTYYERKDGTPNKNMKVLTLQTTSHVTCQRAIYKQTEGLKQDVWCVRTANESWVIRQGNTITITGNTLYGAGNLKIGAMLYPQLRPMMQMAKGKVIRAKLMAGITGFTRLNLKYTRQAEHQGKVTIIDGRTIPVRNAYSALNTLLQSTGAVLAKYWIKEMMRGIEEDMGLVQGYAGDYQLLGWFHDEVQFACKEEYGQQIADWCEKASIIAGDKLKFALKLESESKVGGSWAECH